MFWRPVMAGVMATLVALYVIADSFLHHQRDVQTCAMSYSRPSFYEIPLASATNTKYKLYLFRQGLVDSTDRLLGVPGLFIPGHAGSYKQVRSIAAETAERYGTAAIDYFTVDLNEEFSALSGQQLLEQAEFLNDAIHHILSELYQDRYSAVVVVGHSMGGIVARLMPWMPNYRPSSIQHILTLATPHLQPPIVLDPFMPKVYATIHHHHEAAVSLVSIAGGTADTIVNSDMAHDGADITVFSTGIPGVWTSCDHMAILWCNQLVRVVATVLAESIDRHHTTGVKPRDQRISIARKHLLAPQALLESSGHRGPKPVALDPVSQLTTLPAKLPLTAAVDIAMLIDTGKQAVGIVTDIKDVAFVGCEHPSGAQCYPLATEKPLELPRPHAASPLYFYRSVGEAYVGVQARSPGFALADTLDHSPKQVNVSMWDLLWRRGVDLPVSSTGIYSAIRIPAIRHPYFAYRLTITCASSSRESECPKEGGVAFAPVVRQSYDHEQKYPRVQLGVPIPVHFFGQPGRVAVFEIWKSYPVRAHLELDWYGSIGKSMIRAAPSLPVYLFTIAIMILQEVTRKGSTFSEGFIYCLKRRVPRWAGVVFGLGWIASTNGTPWWLHSIMFCLAAGHVCLLWAVLNVLLVGLRRIIRCRPDQPSGEFPLFITVLVCCSRVLPVPVVVALLYAYWFGCTALYAQAGQSKGNLFQAVLLVLTSLLPYNVPRVVVYVKDVMVLGWPITMSWESMVPDLPMLGIVLLLITGTTWYPRILKSRVAVIVSQWLIVCGIYRGMLHRQPPFYDLDLFSDLALD